MTASITKHSRILLLILTLGVTVGSLVRVTIWAASLCSQ